MQSEKVARWTLDDRHHERCAVDFCEKGFCRAHRRIYWICQDAAIDPAAGWFGGDGDCVQCRDERLMSRAHTDWVLRQQPGII